MHGTGALRGIRSPRSRLSRGARHTPISPQVGATCEGRHCLRSYATRQIVIGLVIAGVGGLISLASYQAAATNGSGGYAVLWGAVVFGLIKAIRGARLYFAAGPGERSAHR